MIKEEHWFREHVTNALYRYYYWQAYDVAFSHHDASVYAELRAKLDFDDIFKDFRINGMYYEILINPKYTHSEYPPLIRQSKGYCKNEISDIWSYLKRWLPYSKVRVAAN